MPHPDSQSAIQDFCICKLCGHPSGFPACSIGAAQLLICRNCDFHYLDRLDPPPPDDTVSLTEAQRQYMLERLAGNARVLNSRLHLVREFVDLHGCRALDVGTGVGQFLPLLTAAGAMAEGIEPSALRREFARQQFGLDLHRQPLEEPHWRPRHAAFDLLTCWDVLEHVNDPLATLQAAFALLRPGGLLFIETDNRDCASYRLSRLACRISRGAIPLFLAHFYRPVPYGHKQIFRPRQLDALVKRCGFELLAAHPGRTPALPKQTAGYAPPGQIILVARKPVQPSTDSG